MLLELRGHEVEAAADASEALAKVGAFNPQVITTSVRLPGGMDGPTLARTIRQRGDRETIIICITGSGDPAVLHHALRSGCDEVFQKPVDIDVLECAIRARIAGAGELVDR